MCRTCFPWSAAGKDTTDRKGYIWVAKGAGIFKSRQSFSPEDYGTENCVFIPLSGGGGKERLVVIDLEE